MAVIKAQAVAVEAAVVEVSECIRGLRFALVCGKKEGKKRKFKSGRKKKKLDSSLSSFFNTRKYKAKESEAKTIQKKNST
jgi:hypothetical protein